MICKDLLFVDRENDTRCYSLLQLQLPPKRKVPARRRVARLVRTDISPTKILHHLFIHITCPQGLKSLQMPYIAGISTFYASILISCSKYWPIVSINVILFQPVGIATLPQPLLLPYRQPSRGFWQVTSIYLSSTLNSDLIIVIYGEHELYDDNNISRRQYFESNTRYFDDSLIVFSLSWVVYSGCHSGTSVSACGNHDNPCKQSRT